MKIQPKLVPIPMVALCLLVCGSALADESIVRHIEGDTEEAKLVATFLETHRVQRFQLVTVDVSAIRKAMSDYEQPGADGDCCSLTFKIFTDVEVSLYTHKVHAEPLEAWHWSGTNSLDGNETKMASLTVNFGDSVTGNFYGLGGRIRIEPLDRSGTHIIWEAVPFEKTID